VNPPKASIKPGADPPTSAPTDLGGHGPLAVVGEAEKATPALRALILHGSTTCSRRFESRDLPRCPHPSSRRGIRKLGVKAILRAHMPLSGVALSTSRAGPHGRIAAGRIPTTRQVQDRHRACSTRPRASMTDPRSRSADDVIASKNPSRLVNTQHHEVFYIATATTRFSSILPRRHEDDHRQGERSSRPAGFAPDRRRPRRGRHGDDLPIGGDFTEDDRPARSPASRGSSRRQSSRCSSVAPR